MGDGEGDPPTPPTGGSDHEDDSFYVRAALPRGELQSHYMVGIHDAAVHIVSASSAAVEPPAVDAPVPPGAFTESLPATAGAPPEVLPPLEVKGETREDAPRSAGAPLSRAAIRKILDLGTVLVSKRSRNAPKRFSDEHV